MACVGCHLRFLIAFSFTYVCACAHRGEKTNMGIDPLPHRLRPRLSLDHRWRWAPLPAGLPWASCHSNRPPGSRISCPLRPPWAPVQHTLKHTSTQINKNLSLSFLDFILCVCIRLNECMQCPWWPREGSGSPGTGDADSRRLREGAVNRAGVLGRSSKFS